MADMMADPVRPTTRLPGLTVLSKTPYVAVDRRLYEGSWTGKYADNKTFTVNVSNVTGFRAKVQYQSGATNKFQEVLIKDNAFRIGDTKFTLTGYGKATIKNVVTDPATGSTFLDQGLRVGGRGIALIRPGGRWREDAPARPWSNPAC